MNYKEISKGIIRAVLILLALGLGLFLLNEIQIQKHYGIHTINDDINWNNCGCYFLVCSTCY